MARMTFGRYSVQPDHEAARVHCCVPVIVLSVAGKRGAFDLGAVAYCNGLAEAISTARAMDRRARRRARRDG